MADVQPTTDVPLAPVAEGSAPATQPTTTPGRDRDTSGRFTRREEEGEGSLLDWRTTLPETLRSEPTLQKYKSVADLAQATVHQQRMLGSSVQIPKADASPEEWGKFNARLGCPESPDKYSHEPTMLPEGVQLDSEFEKRLKEHAHASGWRPQQYHEAVGFIGTWLQENARMADGQREQTRLDGLKELQKHFGASTPRIRQEALAFYEALGRGLFADPAMGEQLQHEIEASGLANSPRFVAVFSEAFRRMGEGDLLSLSLRSHRLY